MLTFSQRVKRYIPTPIIVMWIAMVGFGFVASGYDTDTGDINFFSLFGILVTMWLGVVQITSNRKYYDEKELRSDIIAAAENALQFRAESGFFVYKTLDNKYNVIIAWRILANPIFMHTIGTDAFNSCHFCVYFRVLSIFQDIDKEIFKKDLGQNNHSELHWWDYQIIMSRINGNYYGRLTSHYNPKRKNAGQLKNMNDTDFIYARQAIGEIHTFGYNRIRDYMDLGDFYNVESLPVNVEI